MSPSGEDLRFERKAYIDQFDRRSIFSMVFQHPALFKEIHHERTVNSLYFDTENYSDARDKIDGLKSRRKTRIRWYGILFGEIHAPVLEIKNKDISLGWKLRYPLSPFIIENRGGTAIQLEYRKPGCSLLPKILMMTRSSAVLISYRRIYFQSADRRFRLTIDDQLRFYSPVRNGHGWTLFPDNPNGVIIELKYSKDDDDDARQITSWFPFRWGSISKYSWGLQLVRHL